MPIAITSRVIPKEELLLLPPLLRWLWKTRRLQPGAKMAFEVSWLGRRVDLATVSRTHRTAAFELKMSHITRALEQAIYNRVVFDRSYVVTASPPRAASVALAADNGIGLILVAGESARQVLSSPYQRADSRWRQRLMAALDEGDR